MYKVLMEGSEVIWNHHANQLRVRAVILPTSNSADSNTDTDTDRGSHLEALVPAPPTLRRLTRIRRPRRSWSPSS